MTVDADSERATRRKELLAKHRAQIEAIHAAQKKVHTIDTLYEGMATRVDIHPSMDGDIRVVELHFALDDETRIILVEPLEGDDDEFDSFWSYLNLDQARQLHEAIGQAIADAIPDV